MLVPTVAGLCIVVLCKVQCYISVYRCGLDLQSSVINSVQQSLNSFCQFCTFVLFLLKKAVPV